MYFDVDLDTVSVSGTETKYNLLDPLLGSTGILATSETYSRPIWRNGAKVYTSRIRLDRIDVRVACTSSYSSLGLPGDLFNLVRMAICVSPSSYRTTLAQLFAAVDKHIFTNNVAKIVCDDTFDVMVQAFDSTDRAAPGMKFRHYTCPLNTIVDCFSNDRTTWDTKAGSVSLSTISDSQLTPHPTLDLHLRIHYRPYIIG